MAKSKIVKNGQLLGASDHLLSLVGPLHLCLKQLEESRLRPRRVMCHGNTVGAAEGGTSAPEFALIPKASCKDCNTMMPLQMLALHVDQCSPETQEKCLTVNYQS